MSTNEETLGQILGGTIRTETTTISLKTGKTTIDQGELIHLSPLEATEQFGEEATADLSHSVKPSFLRKHWAGADAVAFSGLATGAAIACAIAEPCGAIALWIGAVGASGGAVFGGIEFYNNQ